eukprot:scaffold91986_cov21-Tisochrysis_lutea.AAC.1
MPRFAGLASISNIDDCQCLDPSCPPQYYVLRQKGTEPPGTGKYNKHKEEGIYTCAGIEGQRWLLNIVGKHTQGPIIGVTAESTVIISDWLCQHCALQYTGCDQPLYTSKMKFDSGCGWPAFYDEIPVSEGGSVEKSAGQPGLLAPSSPCQLCPFLK